MKKMFLISIVLVLFSGCVSYKVNSYFINYSLYEKKGFFITESSSVNFDYHSVGSITVTVRSGSATENVEEGREVGVFGSFRHADVLDGFDHLYTEAIKRSANGVINLKYSRFESGWIITGMLIKK